LPGSLLASATVISHVMWPSDSLCLFRNVGFHISTNLLYAPLLVKTVRIYRIFTAAKSSILVPSYVSGTAQFTMTVGLVAVQVIGYFIAMNCYIAVSIFSILRPRMHVKSCAMAVCVCLECTIKNVLTLLTYSRISIARHLKSERAC
jgi:hypothetical protein